MQGAIARAERRPEHVWRVAD